MATPFIHTSFGAGELSRNLYARVDLDKYHVGAALLRNFFVDYRGGASTRAGYEYIARAKSNGTPRLIPFSFSTTQTYVIELGNQYARFYANGAPLIGSSGVITGITNAAPGVVTFSSGTPADGDTVVIEDVQGMTQLNGRTFIAIGVVGSTCKLQDLNGNVIDTSAYGIYTGFGVADIVYELATPWFETDLPLLKFAQSADVMTLTHPFYIPRLLERLTASTFQITELVVGPQQAFPTGLVATPSKPSATGNMSGYVVTAVNSKGEESLPSFPAYALYDITSTNQNVPLQWTTPSGTPPTSYNIYKWGPVAPSSSGSSRHIMNSVFGYIGSSQVPQFSDNNIAADYTRAPPSFQNPFAPGEIEGLQITVPGSGWTDAEPPTLTFSGTGSGASGYGIIDDTGALSGTVLVTGGQWSANPTVAVVGGAGSGATVISTGISDTFDIYPSCCAYFQQRQVFAASINDPQTIWMSQVGNVFNFDESPAVLDSDAITIALASRQVNQIKSMVSMPSGLVLLTSGGAWLLSGGGNSLAVTPIDIAAQPQASSGANDMPPIVVNNDILYVQSRGSIVRDLVYNFYVQSFFGVDRSALANHLFFGYELLEWCYAEEPFRTFHVVRNDGQILVMTYVPEQEVYAWSHFDTNGQFISTCSVVEGQEDAVYVVTKRFLQGAWVNCIERLASRQFYGNVEFANALDCSLQTAQDEPNATLTLSAAFGDNVLATVDADIFTPDSVGNVIRGLLGGKAVVTNYLSPAQAVVTVERDGLGSPTFPIVPNSAGVPAPLLSGTWMIAPSLTTFNGADQLAGQTVSALADGQVINDVVVSSDGFFTLPQAASFVTLGLPFQAQLQTLYLDIGEPTIQGKRKLLPNVEVRLDTSRGVKVGGIDFDPRNLTELKDPSIIDYAVPAPLFSGDIFTPIFTEWSTKGEVFVQQDYPLPATILGLIPQVLLGDTQR